MLLTIQIRLTDVHQLLHLLSQPLALVVGGILSQRLQLFFHLLHGGPDVLELLGAHDIPVVRLFQLLGQLRQSLQVSVHTAGDHLRSAGYPAGDAVFHLDGEGLYGLVRENSHHGPVFHHFRGGVASFVAALRTVRQQPGDLAYGDAAQSLPLQLGARIRGKRKDICVAFSQKQPQCLESPIKCEIMGVMNVCSEQAFRRELGVIGLRDHVGPHFCHPQRSLQLRPQPEHLLPLLLGEGVPLSFIDTVLTDAQQSIRFAQEIVRIGDLLQMIAHLFVGQIPQEIGGQSLACFCYLVIARLCYFLLVPAG